MAPKLYFNMLFVLAFCNAADAGVYFKEMIGAENENGKVASLFHTKFHHCGLEDSCNFVIRNMQSGKYSTASREQDLPANKEGFNIWKKEEVPIKAPPTPTSTVFQSCKSALANGAAASGVYDLQWSNGTRYKGFCNMTIDGGGWTVIQRRVTGTVDFARNWQDYEKGFGDVSGDYWMGLEGIHDLAKDRGVTLRIDMLNTDGVWASATYSHFRIENKTAKYKLRLGMYKGGAAHNGFAPNNGCEFSTKDQDNDKWASNCAVRHQGGWWYNTCSYAFLNSLFYTEASKTIFRDDKMSWLEKYGTWEYGKFGNLKFSEMKIRYDKN